MPCVSTCACSCPLYSWRSVVLGQRRLTVTWLYCRAEVDGYLSVRQPGAWLSGLRGRLLLPPGEVVVAGTHYDVPLINALVFYIGIRVRQPVRRHAVCFGIPPRCSTCSVHVLTMGKDSIS